MSTPSAVPAFIDQLLVIAQATFPLATSVVQVFDGPGNTSDETGQSLHIGCTDPTQLSEAASSSQEFPYASGVFRREEMTIDCISRAWSGDDDMKTLRDLAYSQIATLTTALVADASFSGTVLAGRAVGSGIALWQGYPDGQNNLEARVPFQVTAMVQFQG